MAFVRRCPFCCSPVSIGAVLKYRLRNGAEQLRCGRCGSVISYAFAPSLTWPATGFAAGLVLSELVSKLTNGSYVTSTVVFGFTVAVIALVVYYATPLKSG